MSWLKDSAVGGAPIEFDCRSFPINSGVVIPQPIISEEDVVGVELGYPHGDNFLMFVTNGHVNLNMVGKHSLGIWSTICVSYGNWSIERYERNMMLSDEVFVDGRTGTAAVHKNFGGDDGMFFFLMDLDRKGKLTSMSSNECSVRVCWHLDFR